MPLIATSLPKVAIVEFALAACIIFLSFLILRVAKIFIFSTISCMGWMPINFRNIGYLETSLTGNESNFRYVHVCVINVE